MPAERTYVVRSGSSATNSTTVALGAATAKSVIAFLGSSTDTLALIEFTVSFPSVTATDVPAVVELGEISALGTMTAFTPIQDAGPILASSATAGHTATVEPTYQNIRRTFYCPIQNGVFAMQFPLGREPTVQAVSRGFAIRVTSPSATNCYASLVYAE
jgi:hypothetical protein